MDAEASSPELICEVAKNCSLIVALHCYNAGRLALGSDKPMIVVCGGTDINVDIVGKN